MKARIDQNWRGKVKLWKVESVPLATIAVDEEDLAACDRPPEWMSQTTQSCQI